MTLLLALLMHASAQDTVCEPDASVDRNCNLVDAQAEGLVDLTDPECASAIAQDDRARSADSWFDYPTLGCTASVLAYDADDDGFSHGRLTLMDGNGRVYLDVMLQCDACPDVSDSQLDSDCDNLGDACDPCPELAEPTDDSDGDGWGDACDPCPFTANEDPTDADGDGTPDVCDTCVDLADDQTDADADGIGDACDPCPNDSEPARDIDGDGIFETCGPSMKLGGGASCAATSHGVPTPVWLALIAGALVLRRTQPRTKRTTT